MMKKQLLLLIPLFCLTIAPAQAVIIFSDDFDAETPGFSTSLINWSISDGTIDVIGAPGPHTLQPLSYGRYLDMDGSTSDAGKITSDVMSLLAGNYSLSYDLAGNQRDSSTERVDVVVSGEASMSHSLARTDPFSTFMLNFTLLSTTNITLSFEGFGGDNLGMLLDNVILERGSVPDTGSALALLGAALFGLAAIRRKALRK